MRSAMLAGALQALMTNQFYIAPLNSPTGPAVRRRRKLKKYMQDHQRPNRRRK